MSKNRKKMSPYQRIMRAARLGKGVVLTFDEVFSLSMDDAIYTVAHNDDEDPNWADAPGRITRRPDTSREKQS